MLSGLAAVGRDIARQLGNELGSKLLEVQRVISDGLSVENEGREVHVLVPYPSMMPDAIRE
jgi:hypothetical protein